MTDPADGRSAPLDLEVFNDNGALLASVVCELQQHDDQPWVKSILRAVRAHSRDWKKLWEEVARLRAERETPRWQPIESAPKDGTAFLVHGGIARWHVGDDGAGAWFSITGYEYPGRLIMWPVTHWMPLPAPPEGEPTP